MPKIISYTPEWLLRPSPGFQFFNTRSQSQPPTSARAQNGHDSGSVRGIAYEGPDRTIARRGAEIFAVVGKHIRWTDLSMLKYDYEEQQQTPSKRPKPRSDGFQAQPEDEGPEDSSYRVLKIPIGEQIRQLSISPNGNLLALATSQTVHVAILPDSSHLGQTPNKPIKLKSYTIGPTTHVLSQAQVTNILWHPFGVGGNCLVTVTADAAVRLWEFDRENRWSCDNPALAIDLKKLVMGSSEEDGFSPDKFGRNRRFSLDNVGLEVASACFGGIGASDEAGWNSMTLWIAMKGGDVYALCPLLPSKWQPSTTTMASLSATALAKEAAHQKEGPSETEDERRARNQLDWIREVDSQEPTLLDIEDESSVEIYRRPNYPGAVSRLQGPFQMLPEDVDDDLELSDIHVIAARLDEEEYLDNEESDSESGLGQGERLSVSVINLLTRRGRLYACLDLDGVEGQWLPRKKPKQLLPPLDEQYLMVLEGLDTLNTNEQLDLQWPTFSYDADSPYSFFVTHGKGVLYLSLDPWISKFEQELKSSEKLGSPLRIANIKHGPGMLRERILSFQDEEFESSVSMPACLIFQDSDLGHFLLTSTEREPRAVTFDQPYEPYSKPLDSDANVAPVELPDMDLLNIGPVREAYRESELFYIDSSLPRFVEKHVSERHKRLFKDQIRLSTATLDMMTQAHRVLSLETHRIGLAASDLFRRCERLQDELRDQISRARDLAERTDKVAGEDADPYVETIKDEKEHNLEQRLSKVRARQDELTTRYENVRKIFNNGGGKALSEKEQSWAVEVGKAKGLIEPAPDEDEDESGPAPELLQRCREVGHLRDELLARAKASSTDTPHINGEGGSMIPQDIREMKVEEVGRMLSRESELIDGAQSRLQHLSGITIA